MNNSVNNTQERSALMKKIQALSFAKVESELFLDTHPECRQALEYYKEVVKNLAEATAEYSAKYGPIFSADIQGDKWTWTDGNWPWHNMGKEE